MDSLALRNFVDQSDGRLSVFIAKGASWLSDKDLATLSDLKFLTHLEIEGSPLITDGGLSKSICGRSLRSLVIRNCRLISDSLNLKLSRLY